MEGIINYTIGILGLVLGIVGIYLTIRSNKKKEPVYSIKSNNLISDAISKYPNLKVSYNRKKVENLTVSKVLFFNRGAETLTQEDMYHTKNRTRIIAKEGVKLLDISILQRNDASEMFSENLHEDENYIIIWFDYLDKNKGVVYQVIHTGSSSEDIDIVGDIRGVPKLIRIPPDKFTLPPNRERFFIEVALRLVFIIVIVVTLMYSALIIKELRITTFFMTIALLFVALDFIPFAIRLMRSRALPEGLEKFNE